MENFDRKINHNFSHYNDETKQIFHLLSLITILSFEIMLSQKQKRFLQNLLQNVKLNCIHYIKRFKLKCLIAKPAHLNGQMINVKKFSVVAQIAR